MTQNTQQLIESLAHNMVPVRTLAAPISLAVRLSGVLLAYALVTGFVLGLRPDLWVQLHRPFFLMEIILLITTTLSSVCAAVYLAFPDQYQHPSVAYLPLYSFIAFILVLAVQAFLPADARMVIPTMGAHGVECTMCVASVAVIPSALMFIFLRRGASAYPPLSGACIVLAAAGIGCLMLRLSEVNDSLLHLTLWHYIPTVLFAIVGAFIGKLFLKW